MKQTSLNSPKNFKKINVFIEILSFITEKPYQWFEESKSQNVALSTRFHDK